MYTDKIQTLRLQKFEAELRQTMNIDLDTRHVFKHIY